MVVIDTRGIMQSFSTTAEKLAQLQKKIEIAKEPMGEKAILKRAKKGNWAIVSGPKRASLEHPSPLLP